MMMINRKVEVYNVCQVWDERHCKSHGSSQSAGGRLFSFTLF